MRVSSKYFRPYCVHDYTLADSIRHCVGAGESENSGPNTRSCERRDREYNIPLRIGSLFVVLVTSSIAVFGPIVYAKVFAKSLHSYVFTTIKQFGAGIMMATAFIHVSFILLHLRGTILIQYTALHTCGAHVW
jgi:hypothetical protein